MRSQGVSGMVSMAEQAAKEKGKGMAKEDEGGVSSLEKHLESI